MSTENIVGEIVFPADPTNLTDYGSMSALVKVPHEIPKAKFSSEYDRWGIRFYSKPGTPLGDMLSNMSRGDEIELVWDGQQYKPVAPPPGTLQRQPIAHPAIQPMQQATVEIENVHRPLMNDDEVNAFLVLIDQHLDILVAARQLLGTKEGAPDLESQPAQQLVATAYIQAMRQWPSKRAGLLAITKEATDVAIEDSREAAVLNAGSVDEAVNYIHLGTETDIPGSHVITKTLTDLFGVGLGTTPDDWLRAAQIFWSYAELIGAGKDVNDAKFETELKYGIKPERDPAPWG